MPPDDELSLAHGQPQYDLRKVLSAFGELSLIRLLEASQTGRLAKGAFRTTDDHGCVLYVLNRSIRCTASLMTYAGFDEETMQAARRLVRHWDSGALSTQELEHVLVQILGERACINVESSNVGHDAHLNLPGL
jgi:hypothetical protein